MNSAQLVLELSWKRKVNGANGALQRPPRQRCRGWNLISDMATINDVLAPSALPTCRVRFLRFLSCPSSPAAQGSISEPWGGCWGTEGTFRVFFPISWAEAQDRVCNYRGTDVELWKGSLGCCHSQNEDHSSGALRWLSNTPETWNPLSQGFL